MVEWLLPSILTWYRENIMEEDYELDLSLNRSLEELICSYFEAHGAGVDLDEDSTEKMRNDYYVLENYLSDMGAI